MQNIKFEIIRLKNPMGRFETGADILVLKKWSAATLYIALLLCESAQQTYGGNWVPAHNGKDTVTVYLGYKASDFRSKRKAA